MISICCCIYDKFSKAFLVEGGCFCFEAEGGKRMKMEEDCLHKYIFR